MRREARKSDGKRGDARESKGTRGKATQPSCDEHNPRGGVKGEKREKGRVKNLSEE